MLPKLLLFIVPRQDVHMPSSTSNACRPRIVRVVKLLWSLRTKEVKIGGHFCTSLLDQWSGNSSPHVILLRLRRFCRVLLSLCDRTSLSAAVFLRTIWLVKETCKPLT